jgi:hypothetical protein
MTHKLKKFVKEYQATGDGTKAVIAAGYDVKNKKVAQVIGSQNLKRPSVKSALERNSKLFESAIVDTVKWGMESDKPRQREIGTLNARWGYEILNGKATQRVETKNMSVEVKLDLSGIRLGTHYEQVKPLKADNDTKQAE